MAIMQLQSKMVFWKIYADTWDITPLCGSFVSGIKVKDTVLPLPTHSKKEHAPSEATISITSKNYIEDIFTEGMPIRIYMGYDRVIQPLVFSGVISKLPEGSARDMMNYTVHAYSNEIKMADKEKIRIFSTPKKAAIIAQIAAENGWTPDIQIKDAGVIPPDFMPSQRARTDLQILVDLAYGWNCLCWFESPNTLHFIDESEAHRTGDLNSKDAMLNYILGYRTDMVKCNVETVSWKYQTGRAAQGPEGGIKGYNEDGALVGKNQYRMIDEKGNTWELKPPHLIEAEAGKDPRKFGSYLGVALRALPLFQSWQTRKQYFCIVHYADGLHHDVDEVNGQGFDIVIHLNEGDPNLKPPRTALLYAGAMNPRADSSFLPRWMFRNASAPKSPAKLNVNETTLSLEHGMLKSELKCTMAF